MITVYGLFKFLHIVSAIGWIGGFVTFSILSARRSRTESGGASHTDKPGAL
jgi:putative copper export protein